MSKQPKLPTKGLCPLMCFDEESVIEKNGRLSAKPLDFEKNLCFVPALYIAEGSIPTASHFIDCAAIDSRSSYLNCQWFQQWFWVKVAHKKALLEVGNIPKRLK